MHRLRAIVESERFVPSCLLAALVLRLAVVALFPVPPISDFQWYYDCAAELAAGRGLVFHGLPTAYWPAGYPFFLAAIFVFTGPSVLAAQLANVVLAVASLFLAHRIALRLTGSRFAAGLALVVLAFYPNQIAYCALVANEMLVTFLLLAGIALLLRVHDAPERWPSFAATGVVFGLSCLVKPQTVVLPTVVVAWMAWRARPSLRTLALRLVVVNAALGIVILPWMVRNYRVFGHVVFIANSGGVNLFLGNNADASGAYPSNDLAPKLSAAFRLPGASEYEIDRTASRLAVDYAVHHPARVLALVPRKIWHLYAKDADAISWIEESQQTIGRLVVWKLVAQVYYVGLFTLFLAALAWPRRGRRGIDPPDRLPLVIVATFTAIYCVYFGQSRFHFPLMPWIAIYAGAFVTAFSPAPAAATARPGAGVAARA